MHLTSRWRALHVVTASAALALSAVILPNTAAAAGNTYYVAPTGNDSAAGTQTAPFASIARAQAVATPGDTVYFRGGTYAYTRANSACASRTARVDAITLNKSGTSGNPIRYWAYPGEKPVFDFSRMGDDCRIKGFSVTGNWLHLKGLEVTGVRQNNNLNAESWGIWISGRYNTFEQIDTHHNMGAGLFIQNGRDNLVLDSDSHENYDANSADGPGENADGLSACPTGGRHRTWARSSSPAARHHRCATRRRRCLRCARARSTRTRPASPAPGSATATPSWARTPSSPSRRRQPVRRSGDPVRQRSQQ